MYLFECICIYIDVSHCKCVWVHNKIHLEHDRNMCTSCLSIPLPFPRCQLLLSPLCRRWSYYTYTTIKHAMLSAWSTPKCIHNRDAEWYIESPVQGEHAFSMHVCMYACIRWAMCKIQESIQTELNSIPLNSTQLNSFHAMYKIPN